MQTLKIAKKIPPRVTSKKTTKITSKTRIDKIIERCPDAVFVLMEYGLMCAGCKLAGNHGLEETKEMYGLSDTDVTEMLKEINKLIEKQK